MRVTRGACVWGWEIDNPRRRKVTETVDWQEYDAMCTPRLKPQVQQSGNFTTGWRVFGRTPKLPIGAARAPDFKYFTNPNDSLVTQTRDVLAKLRGIRRGSLECDSHGKFNYDPVPKN